VQPGSGAGLLSAILHRLRRQATDGERQQLDVHPCPLVILGYLEPREIVEQADTQRVDLLDRATLGQRLADEQEHQFHMERLVEVERLLQQRQPVEEEGRQPGPSQRGQRVAHRHRLRLRLHRSQS
jgi:hypothetical protein